MDLNMFLPAGKPEQGGKAGNGKDPRFDNFFPRREVFAESGQWIIGGEFLHDDIWKGQYGAKFREMFPNSIQVSTKFHHDLDRLSQENPDNEQFKNALKNYMDKMPDTPDAYLKTDMFAPPKPAPVAKPPASTP